MAKKTTTPSDAPPQEAPPIPLTLVSAVLVGPEDPDKAAIEWIDAGGALIKENVSRRHLTQQVNAFEGMEYPNNPEATARVKAFADSIKLKLSAFDGAPPDEGLKIVKPHQPPEGEGPDVVPK